MKRILSILFVLTITLSLNAKEYHVAKYGHDINPGTKESPLLTIQAAANLAMPGRKIPLRLPVRGTRKTNTSSGWQLTIRWKLPVWMNGNVYYYGAKPSVKDSNMVVEPEFDPGLKLTEEDGHVYLQMTLSKEAEGMKTLFVTSELLGKAKILKLGFENPDGSALKIDTDYLGKRRASENPSIGPFEGLGEGRHRLMIW